MGSLSAFTPPLPLPAGPEDPLLNGWYHTIELGNGMVSRGHFDHRSVVDCYGIPESLEGMTVLDVGTGDGFFAFEMEKRGAARVVAIDVDRIGDCDWLRKMRPLVPEATMAAETWKVHFLMAHALRRSKVERVTCNVYDLSPERVGTFDLVFCGDLLVHLQNPLLMLQNIRSVTEGVAIVETLLDETLEATFPNEPFVRFGAVLYEAEPGESNTFWTVSTRALQQMLVYAGFASTEPQGVFKLPPHGLAATSVLARTA